MTAGRPLVRSRGAVRPLGLAEVRLTGKLGWTGNFLVDAMSWETGRSPQPEREIAELVATFRTPSAGSASPARKRCSW